MNERDIVAESRILVDNSLYLFNKRLRAAGIWGVEFTIKNTPKGFSVAVTHDKTALPPEPEPEVEEEIIEEIEFELEIPPIDEAAFDEDSVELDIPPSLEEDSDIELG